MGVQRHHAAIDEGCVLFSGVGMPQSMEGNAGAVGSQIASRWRRMNCCIALMARSVGILSGTNSLWPRSVFSSSRCSIIVIRSSSMGTIRTLPPLAERIDCRRRKALILRVFHGLFVCLSLFTCARSVRCHMGQICPAPTERRRTPGR